MPKSLGLVPLTGATATDGPAVVIVVDDSEPLVELEVEPPVVCELDEDEDDEDEDDDETEVVGPVLGELEESPS